MEDTVKTEEPYIRVPNMKETRKAGGNRRCKEMETLRQRSEQELQIKETEVLKWKMEQDEKKLKDYKQCCSRIIRWINHNNVWNSYKKQLKLGEPPRVCTMRWSKLKLWVLPKCNRSLEKMFEYCKKLETHLIN